MDLFHYYFHFTWTKYFLSNFLTKISLDALWSISWPFQVVRTKNWPMKRSDTFGLKSVFIVNLLKWSEKLIFVQKLKKKVFRLPSLHEVIQKTPSLLEIIQKTREIKLFFNFLFYLLNFKNFFIKMQKYNIFLRRNIDT